LKGEFYSDFSASSDWYRHCGGELPNTSGNVLVKSPADNIEAEHDLNNVVLRFPFPSCRKKK